MPELDGYERHEPFDNENKGRKRAIDRNCRCIYVALTANAIQGDKEKCLAAGMDDYVQQAGPIA